MITPTPGEQGIFEAVVNPGYKGHEETRYPCPGPQCQEFNDNVPLTWPKSMGIFAKLFK